MRRNPALLSTIGDYKEKALVYSGWQVGDVGILVSVDIKTRPTSWRLYDTPPLENLSRKPLERGWCGSTNGVSITAHGKKRVTRLTPISFDIDEDGVQRPDSFVAWLEPTDADADADAKLLGDETA